MPGLVAEALRRAAARLDRGAAGPERAVGDERGTRFPVSGGRIDVDEPTFGGAEGMVSASRAGQGVGLAETAGGGAGPLPGPADAAEPGRATPADRPMAGQPVAGRPRASQPGAGRSLAGRPADTVAADGGEAAAPRGGLGELVERWSGSAPGSAPGARPRPRGPDRAGDSAGKPASGRNGAGADPDGWGTPLTSLHEPAPAAGGLTVDDLEDALDDLLRREAHRHGLDGGSR